MATSEFIYWLVFQYPFNFALFYGVKIQRQFIEIIGVTLNVE